MASKTEIKGPYQDVDGMWCAEATTTTTTTITYRVDTKEGVERVIKNIYGNNASAKGDE